MVRALGRRENVLLASGTILLTTSLIFQMFNTFGVSYRSLGQYTGILTHFDYTVIRIVQTQVGVFMAVLGWRTSVDKQVFSSLFGRPPSRSRSRFWAEITINEVFGMLIVWSVFAVTQSGFYFLSDFPVSQFELAGELVLFVGEFLIARSTFGILAELLKNGSGSRSDSSMKPDLVRFGSSSTTSDRPERRLRRPAES